jgi:hypothetical protein
MPQRSPSVAQIDKPTKYARQISLIGSRFRFSLNLTSSTQNFTELPKAMKWRSGELLSFKPTIQMV